MNGKPDGQALLPPIPAKRYFTIGEVSDLCGVKPHVLRYWEQEFTQLRPMKRRGNRRYYQHHEVLLVRRIRELLYEEGFTINGARNRLGEVGGARPRSGLAGDETLAAELTHGVPMSALLPSHDDDPPASGASVRAKRGEATFPGRASSGQQVLAFTPEAGAGPNAVRQALEQALDLLR